MLCVPVAKSYALFVLEYVFIVQLPHAATSKRSHILLDGSHGHALHSFYYFHFVHRFTELEFHTRLSLTAALIMASFHNMNNYMVGSRNQDAVNHVITYMERMASANINASIFDRLANLPCGPPFTESVFDRALGFLRAQYEEERDSEWATALKPWECRLLNHTTGASFTKVFCTQFFIPFDGCYEDKRDVGRLDSFLTIFDGLAARAAGNAPISGAINPLHVKELVFFQDPLFTSTDHGSIRTQSHNKAVWHFLKRYDEDLKGGKLPTVTPKRAKAYEKMCGDAHLQEMDEIFGYDPNKVCLMWIRIIDLLRYLPNLEVFK